MPTREIFWESVVVLISVNLYLWQHVHRYFPFFHVLVLYWYNPFRIDMACFSNFFVFGLLASLLYSYYSSHVYLFIKFLFIMYFNWCACCFYFRCAWFLSYHSSKYTKHMIRIKAFHWSRFSQLQQNERTPFEPIDWFR